MTLKRHFSSFTFWGSCLAAALVLAPLRADILNVTGPNSSQNTPPVILSTPPPDVTDHCVSNLGQQGFNEKQQVTTTKGWSVDGGGTIPQGTTYVNSEPTIRAFRPPVEARRQTTGWRPFPRVASRAPTSIPS